MKMKIKINNVAFYTFFSIFFKLLLILSLSRNHHKIDLNHYQKGKRINRGGFGVVYQVQNKEIRNFYATKIIDCGDDQEQCNKLIDREVLIMMSINLPTLAKLTGYSKVDFQGETNITLIYFLKNFNIFILIMNSKLIRIIFILFLFKFMFV